METYYEKYKRRIRELDTMRQDLDEREKEIVSDFTAEREQFRASAPKPEDSVDTRRHRKNNERLEGVGQL